MMQFESFRIFQVFRDNLNHNPLFKHLNVGS